MCPQLLQMIRLSDAELLQQSSTSPEQEGPGFCEDVRNTLQWMLQADNGRGDPAMYSWAADSGWVQEAAAAEEQSRELAIAM